MLSRRHLMKSATLGAASLLPLWYVEESLSQPAPPAPKGANDKPGILLIGCGGQGRGDAKSASRFGDVVAVCDVDERRVADAVADFPRAMRYRDFRKAVADKDVDLVVNGTPDHWHTLVNLHVMRQGKDVYSEKPLTLTIDEGRRLVEEAKKTGRILQTGSQQRSERGFRLACELVRNGRIGRLRRVLVALPAGRHDGPFEPEPVPEWLDWDFWQGQAPATEYVPQRCHGTFRYWWEYSAGTITDWGAHHLDIAQWGIGADGSGPTSVVTQELTRPVPGGFTTPADYWIEYEYADGVRVTCLSTRADEWEGRQRRRPQGRGQRQDGNREEPRRDEPRRREGQRQELPHRPGLIHNGVRFEGDDGWIFVTRGRIAASDPDLLEQPLVSGAQRLYASDDHMGNFFECVRTRKAPICAPEIGHSSVTLCHLAGISARLGRRLKWDPAKEQFVGDEEANGMVAREMRKPWSYETV